MASLRRFHAEIPAVTTVTAGHRVTFIGATFHSRSVMIEYDVGPSEHQLMVFDIPLPRDHAASVASAV